MPNTGFDKFFSDVTDNAPYEYQRRLATDDDCRSRLISVPTGCGKTAAVVLAWLWNRIVHPDAAHRAKWPRRLVYCLSMRTLVEQTRDEIAKWLEKLATLQKTSAPPVHEKSSVPPVYGRLPAVVVLMGGEDAGTTTTSTATAAADWDIHPEADAILIGTQDMLLSRALNRGYGMARARWPMHFALLNNDALWVVDETQLFGAGLATTVQLQAFRNAAATGTHTWWMSATLQPQWLRSVDTAAFCDALPPVLTTEPPAAINAARKTLTLARSSEWRLWSFFSSINAARKTLRLAPPDDCGKNTAARVLELLRQTPPPATTLVILNTVKRARAVYAFLEKCRIFATGETAVADLHLVHSRFRPAVADLHLVHSRFRPADRAAWRSRFLNREATAGSTATAQTVTTTQPSSSGGVHVAPATLTTAPAAAAGTARRPRVIVATQVVEAGVDISADALITELAPWTSLVQRFGRAARYGGTAGVTVVDIADEKSAAPYDFAELEAARAELEALATADVSVSALLAHERSLTADPARRAALYPYSPDFLLLRHEVDELFDTTPDLTGADLDISRYIRAGNDTDCQIAWLPTATGNSAPAADYFPAAGELCAVPIGDARKFAENLIKTHRSPVWRWDYLDGEWQPLRTPDDIAKIYPGITLVVLDTAGGYTPETGFDPDSKKPVPPASFQSPVSSVHGGKTNAADASQNSDALSAGDTFQTIREHTAEVRAALHEILRELTATGTTCTTGTATQSSSSGGVHAAPTLAAPAGTGTATDLAALVSVFDHAALWHDLGKAHPAFQSLIKDNPAADTAKAPRDRWLKTYRAADGDERPGFRHELASALALLALHQNGQLPPYSTTSTSTATQPSSSGGVHVGPTTGTTAATDPAFDLLLYLVAAHHGKVRARLAAAPADQEHPVARAGNAMPIRGVLDGDIVPGAALDLPDATLSLEPAALGTSPVTGASWTERVLGLLDRHGAFRLAYYETLLRAADCRASSQSQTRQ